MTGLYEIIVKRNSQRTLSRNNEDKLALTLINNRRSRIVHHAIAEHLQNIAFEIGKCGALTGANERFDLQNVQRISYNPEIKE